MLKIFRKLKKTINKYLLYEGKSTASILPDWSSLIQNSSWNEMRKNSADGEKVLIATSVGISDAVLTLDSVLAVALTLRGAKVSFLICDKVLPACEAAVFQETDNIESFIKEGPGEMFCSKCYAKAYRFYQQLELPIQKYSDFLNKSDIDELMNMALNFPLDKIHEYRWNEYSVGEHSYAGALRFFAKSDLSNEPYGEIILRKYFAAGLITSLVAERVLSQSEIKSASFHHGIYIPQGMMGDVSRKEGISISNWAVAYRKQRFIFSKGDTYHHTLMNEPVSTWENIQWTDELDNKLMEYLYSRWHGSWDWIKFHDRSVEDLDEVSKTLGIDFSKTCIGMLTNVAWDAQLHYPANAFSNMIEWIIETVEYFKNRNDLQLIIRVHPAELKGIVSRQTVMGELKKAFTAIPGNVFMIGPESPFSTYAVMQACDSVIIYGTKTGVELSCMGIPIIVAGEAWIRNKGITLDAKNKDEYFSLLERLPLGKRLSPEEIIRAKKYAFHFFFRRMIPLSFMEPTNSFPPFRLSISNINDLLPHKDQGLDVICNGIVSGSEFVYPAERE